MRRVKQVASVLFAAGFAALAGWSSTRGGEAQSPEPVPPPETPEPIPGGPTYNSLEVHLALAREIPGFGGYFWDPQANRLKVYLKDPPTETMPLITKLTAWFGAHPAVGPDIASRVDVLQGQYNFEQLELWKIQARTVFSVPEVQYTDANEGLNRIQIGLTSWESQAAIEQKLTEAGVPVEAVVFELTGAATDDLGDPSQYKVSGLAIDHPGDGGACTHGFHATSGGQPGFVTAAHCTPNIGQVDGSVFYQPSDADSSYRIGVEVVDPPLIPGQGSGACTPLGVYCRYSDAVWIRYDSGVATRWGYIAAPQSGNSWDGNQFFRIVEFLGVDQCRQIRMVGKSSGQTAGYVTNTWIEHPSGSQPPVVMIYQHRASYNRTGGDSGGPVFSIVDYWDVRLHGLHWTGGPLEYTQNVCNTQVNRFAVFSDINMIMNELSVANFTYLDAPGGGGGGGR